MKNCLTNKKFACSNGEQTRDFIFIDDVVQLTMMILNSKVSIGKIYNIGTGIKTTVQQVLNKLINNYGKEIKVEYSNPTPGDQMGIRADMSLIKNDFEIGELISLDNGLETMISWAINEIK